MKIKDIKFVKSATNPSNFPDYNYPEFAFIGRSNVGKSSLINMLVNRKSLVKTSQTPGKTKLVNFFLANESISLVDLPGYGYAKVDKTTKKGFLPMISKYLQSRNNLKLVFLLLDIRRKPDDTEKEIITFLAANNIPTVLTVTKSDKLSKNQTEKQLKVISEILEVDRDCLFISSSLKKKGKEDLLSLIGEHSQNS